MKILITGATGFIGSHLLKYLAGRCYEVYGCGRHWSQEIMDFHKWIDSDYISRCKSYQKVEGIFLCDITDYYRLYEAIEYILPDVVIHLAAQAIVSKSYEHPILTFRTNFEGTYNVLKAVSNFKNIHLIYQSSDKVYGSNTDVKEDHPFQPVDLYSISKAATDRLVQSYMDRMKITILRSCNIYGLDLNLTRIIPYSIMSCIKGIKPKIRNPNAVRQFLYIKDYVRVIEMIIEKDLAGIYNIGSNDIISIGELVDKICSHFNMKYEVVTPDKYKPEPSRQSVNWDKIKSLGFTPKYTIDDGLEETIHRFEGLYEYSDEFRRLVDKIFEVV